MYFLLVDSGVPSLVEGGERLSQAASGTNVTSESSYQSASSEVDQPSTNTEGLIFIVVLSVHLLPGYHFINQIQ